MLFEGVPKPPISLISLISCLLITCWFRYGFAKDAQPTQPAGHFIYDKSSIFVLFPQMTFVLNFTLFMCDLKRDIVRWCGVSLVLQVILGWLYTYGRSGRSQSLLTLKIQRRESLTPSRNRSIEGSNSRRLPAIN